MINPREKYDFEVSVCMLCYNHEQYIQKAIEGVLMQKTKFPVKLIIGEDNSTDNSHKICKTYKTKNPQQIHILTTAENLGIKHNFIRTLNACSGKYIAICEGDDYWSDPYKLQKQVDFLENHSEYSFSCHNYKTEDVNLKTIVSNSNKTNCVFENKEIDLNIFSSKWITKTLTIVLRKELLNIKEFDKYKHFRDSHLIYHLLKQKKAIFQNFYGGVYRIHNEGCYSKLNKEQKNTIAAKVYDELYFFNPDKHLKSKLIKTLNYYLRDFLKSHHFAITNKTFRSYIIKLFFIEKNAINFLKILTRSFFI